MMAEEGLAQPALATALANTKENEFPWRADCQLAFTLLAINPQTADAAAQKLLEKRLTEKAKDPVALTRLAGIYARDGLVDKALGTYQTMLTEFPAHLPTILSMARLYATKDVNKACQMAKDAFKLAPYDGEVQHFLGQMAYATKDFKLSVNVLQEAVKQPVNDPQPYFDLAQANFAIGKITEAQSALSVALSLKPVAALATKSQQMLELAQKLSAATIPASDAVKLDEILKQSPDYLPALAVRAGLFAQTGNSAAAIAGYEKILTLYPEFAPAQKALALLYLKDPAKRNRAYDLAVQARNFYPEDASLTKVQGIIQFEKGDYLRAASLLKQSAIALTSDPEVFYYLGSAEYETKDRAASKSNLQRSLSLKLAEPLAASARKLLADMK